MGKIFPDCRKEKFAWPGGYPLVYLLKARSQFRGFEFVACADCAGEAVRAKEVEGWMAVEGATPFIHYEGASIECELCDVAIESAYGEGEEEDPCEP